jgi:DNA gyrase/topoisomerase IV subunit A
MVHIIRQRTDGNAIYLTIRNEPTAKELGRVEGYENLGSVTGTSLEAGKQYDASKLRELIGYRHEKVEREIKKLEEERTNLQKVLNSIEGKQPKK